MQYNIWFGFYILASIVTTASPLGDSPRDSTASSYSIEDEVHLNVSVQHQLNDAAALQNLTYSRWPATPYFTIVKAASEPDQRLWYYTVDPWKPQKETPTIDIMYLRQFLKGFRDELEERYGPSSGGLIKSNRVWSDILDPDSAAKFEISISRPYFVESIITDYMIATIEDLIKNLSRCGPATVDLGLAPIKFASFAKAYITLTLSHLGHEDTTSISVE